MMKRMIIILALSALVYLSAPDASAQNQKISELNAITGANTAPADEFAIVDTDAAETKRITRDELIEAIAANLDVLFLEQENGDFAVEGDAQTRVFVLRNSTTDGTQTELFADGSAADISVPSDCSIHFRISIAARRTDADNESAAYFFEGAIDNNAGTTALVSSIGKVVVAEDTAAWDATVTADDTNDGINVLVTGEAAKTIRWVARAETTEVCG